MTSNWCSFVFQSAFAANQLSQKSSHLTGSGACTQSRLAGVPWPPSGQQTAGPGLVAADASLNDQGAGHSGSPCGRHAGTGSIWHGDCCSLVAIRCVREVPAIGQLGRRAQRRRMRTVRRGPERCIAYPNVRVMSPRCGHGAHHELPSVHWRVVLAERSVKKTMWREIRLVFSRATRGERSN